MTKDTINRLRRIYKILLSCSIVISGILLIIGSVYIFYSSKGYSREIVAEIFSMINIPIYICLALIIGDMIWEFVNPSRVIKKKSKKITSHSEQPTKIDKKNTIIKIAILFISITVLLFGFFTGGYEDVLTKAINICTECIGLG